MPFFDLLVYNNLNKPIFVRGLEAGRVRGKFMLKILVGRVGPEPCEGQGGHRGEQSANSCSKCWWAGLVQRGCQTERKAICTGCSKRSGSTSPSGLLLRTSALPRPSFLPSLFSQVRGLPIPALPRSSGREPILPV